MFIFRLVLFDRLWFGAGHLTVHVTRQVTVVTVISASIVSAVARAVGTTLLLVYHVRGCPISDLILKKMFRSVRDRTGDSGSVRP